MKSRKHIKCGGHFELLKAASDHKVYQCDKCGEWVTLYSVDRSRGWATEIEDDPLYKGGGDEYESDELNR